MTFNSRIAKLHEPHENVKATRKKKNRVVTTLILFI